MEFNYKCPVCRANNRLTAINQNCRRCKSSLALIYNIKKREFFSILKIFLTKTSQF